MHHAFQKLEPPISERLSDNSDSAGVQFLLHLLGFPLSCHRRVGWTKSPTSNYYYGIFILYILFSFVKDFLAAKKTIPLTISYVQESDNSIFITFGISRRL